MNPYLKSAVQNLDAYLVQVTNLRNAAAAMLETGVQALEPLRPVSPPAVPIGELVAAGAVPEGYAARRARLAKARLGKGKGKGKAKAETSNIEHSTPNIEGKTAALPVRAEPQPSGTERAKTLGGAMKLIITARGTITREAMREALEIEYGNEEFVKDASSGAIAGNLGYWLKNGKLEEAAGGVLKVVDKAFFGNVEFKTGH